MRVEIIRRCSSKYIMLLRIYCGMLAFIAFCASLAFDMWELEKLSILAGGICAVMCCAAVIIPLSFGRISYLRSGGCIKIQKGLFWQRTLLINRSDIYGSEIKGSPLQRKMGLCTVTFFTGNGEVKLRGIELSDGRLLDRMISQEAS